MNLFKRLIVSLLAILWADQVFATTYYIRPDGGTPKQCTGKTNASYPRAGTGRACAWNHYFWALGWNGGAKARIRGGDTVIMDGEYRIGYDPHRNWRGGCLETQTWECYPRPVPSGPSPGKKTKIYGKHYTACSRSKAARLWGAERAPHVLNLQGSDNVEIACLDITDKAQCGRAHPNPGYTCRRDAYPHGNWAEVGISAIDSENVLLKNVYVHGLGLSGVRAGRIQNWEIINSEIVGNPFSGWDGDLGYPDVWADKGTIAFKRVKIEWNGCVERYPDPLRRPAPNSCYNEMQGGYGDAFAPATGGPFAGQRTTYSFTEVNISHNTSDGIDNLYLDGIDKTIVLRSRLEGNTGQQLKFSGSGAVNDSKIIGNCGFFEGRAETYRGGAEFGHCRAYGVALSWTVKTHGATLDIMGSTLYGQGDVIINSGGSVCNGSERLRIRNSILHGDTRWGLGGPRATDYFAAGNDGNGGGSCGRLAADWSGPKPRKGNIVYNTRFSRCNVKGVACANPLFVDKFISWPKVGHPIEYNVMLQSKSPARGRRNPAFGNSTDYSGYRRKNTIGAYEYRAGGE